MRRNNGGFTLIELIVVIVILGILAVTAAPKFIDLQSDARLATLNGMKAAINSAVSLTYGKSLVLGKEKADEGSITINGSPVTVCYGYPCYAHDRIEAVLDIGDFAECVEGVSGDWCYKERADDKSIDIYIANGYTANSQCFVTYTESSAAGSAPKVALSPNVKKC